LKYIGSCTNLKKLNLTGCTTISFEGISNLIAGTYIFLKLKKLGEKDAQGNPIRKEETFRSLIELRLNSIGCDSEGVLLKLT
jgi:Leucine-rich repeat (LRR) protein